MDNIEYKPNSHRYKEEQKNANGDTKRVQKAVVSGKVKTRKNEVRKITNLIVSDNASDLKSMLVMDVLVPAIKDVVEDMFTKGVRLVLRGETGSRSKRSNGEYVSYRSYSDRKDDRYRDSRSRSRFDYDDLVFESRGDADAVLDQMDAIIERYGVVRVADMYDLADRSAPYTSNDYGWTSVRHGEIVRTRDGGYVIKLPRAMPLD
jgi:hypothetical protein